MIKASQMLQWGTVALTVNPGLVHVEIDINSYITTVFLPNMFQGIIRETYQDKHQEKHGTDEAIPKYSYGFASSMRILRRFRLFRSSGIFGEVV
jgi:hypothetical protein